MPPLKAAANNLEFNQNWQPNTGWQEQKLDLTTSNPQLAAIQQKLSAVQNQKTKIIAIANKIEQAIALNKGLRPAISS